MLDEQAAAEAATAETTGAESSTTQPDAAAEAVSPPPRKRAPRKTAAKKKAAEEPSDPAGSSDPAADAASGGTADTDEVPPPRKAAARRTPRKRAESKPSASVEPGAAAEPNAEGIAPAVEGGEEPAQPAEQRSDPDAGQTAAPAKRATRRRTTASSAPAAAEGTTGTTTGTTDGVTDGEDSGSLATRAKAAPPTALLFQPPDPAVTTTPEDDEEAAAEADTGADDGDASGTGDAESTDDTPDGEQDDSAEGEGAARRRRRRGGRRRRKPSGEGGADGAADGQAADGDQPAKGGAGGKAGDKAGDKAGGKAGDKAGDDDEAAETAGDRSGEGDGEGGSTRRRRRRRRSGEGSDADSSDDPDNTVTRVRKAKSAEDEITGFSGSTRLEAKKQRRREGREAGRRRAPVISEAEFLARRESVDRAMVIRQRDDLTQIAVLEDKVLVEHYVARESQTSLIGNVYLGRVQNVLPSMEAAFIDIGKGRNAVLYAGEVNWDALGAKDGNQRKIEQVLKSGQTVLVQVSKDPIGHKGARLTSQISLPGRFLVYVPDGTTSGISRKLPETERNRLKTLLKEIVPESAGVIVRTAAEGASEAELTRDVERLKALWEDISAKVENGNAPQLLYGEPDLTLKVVRDLFTEDFARLVVSGDEAWTMVEEYVQHVAPDLADRLEKHDDSERDAFAEFRVDDQIAKALDRKVWLPSGGSLVIDRTEAMTVVDVNTGKFTGSGGNLEETVTKNNLEAAEEIVRQLRLRDIGGIIVADFIDMVLESNRDLVLRRLIECLGRDRTRHQVAEVTSLGLVQMTRKRIGTGLLEAFSEVCECCQGRGLHLREQPVESKRKQEEEPRRGRRPRGRGKGDETSGSSSEAKSRDGAGDTEHAGRRPTPAEFAAMVRSEKAATDVADTGGSAGDAEQRPADGASPDTAPPEERQEPPAGERPMEEPQPAQAEAEQPQPAQAEAEQPEPAQPEPAQSEAEQPEPAQPEPAQAAAEVPPPPPPVTTEPRIVTSVRRVGARRPAGPPAQSVTGSADHGAAGGGHDGAEELVEASGQPHVPVKKKGSRKR